VAQGLYNNIYGIWPSISKHMQAPVTSNGATLAAATESFFAAQPPVCSFSWASNGPNACLDCVLCSMHAPLMLALEQQPQNLTPG